MNVGGLFSGIGGWELGLERAGFDIAWHCEADAYCRSILERHWPDVPCYPDVRDIGPGVAAVDVLCGGFPCQPVSVGGTRQTEDDERWLWPEFARLIRLLRPRYVLVENVPGLLERGLGLVLGSLVELRYDAEWDCISAAALGAPHVRERVWVVAYPREDRRELSRVGQEGDEGQARAVHFAPGELRGTQPLDAGRSNRGARPDHRGPIVFGRGIRERPRRDPEPRVDRVATRVPERVDRVNALGNALVPQVAELIGRRILEHEESCVSA